MKKTMTKVRLTPTLKSQIIAAIQAGGYPQVAAEAFGVPAEVFQRWLKEPGKTYRDFAASIRQAHGQARLRAESSAFQDDPKVWLAQGPGRERNGKPGWSSAVKPADDARISRNAFEDPDLCRIFNALEKALAPFPEARQAAAQVLHELGTAFEQEHRHESHDP